MPGTKFDKATLETQIANRYDVEIEELQAKRAGEEYTTDEMRLDFWRASCRRAIVDLSQRLGDVSDLELSGFRLPHSPSIGDRNWALRDLDRSIDAKIKAKNKALAYARSLKASEDGVVEIYAADLRRIGYEAN